MSTPQRNQRRNRRAEHVAHTRQQIVTVARDLLISEGYSQFGLEAVAERAGITRMTIYNQFGSRSGLLEAIADDVSQRGDSAKGNSEALALPDALHALVTKICRFWGTDPALFRRMVSLSSLDPQAGQVLEAREQVRHESIRIVVQRLAAEERIRQPFTLEQATAALIALTSFQTCDQMVSLLGTDFPALTEVLLPIIGAIFSFASSTR